MPDVNQPNKQGKIMLTNVKEHNPTLHDFIIDYWKFATAYTPLLSGEEWWETLFSEINYYTDKYTGNPFICDILIIQLEAMTSKFYRSFTKVGISGFIKDWGRFLNDVVYNYEDEAYWDKVTDETNTLCDKYRNTSYFQEIINRSVFSLCKRSAEEGDKGEGAF